MDWNDPYVERGSVDNEDLVQEFGSSYMDFERTGFGVRKTAQELYKLRRDPKERADYELRFEIYEDPPFNQIDMIDIEVIYSELHNYPNLQSTNVRVLVAAFLYRQKYPKGKVTPENLEKFHKAFEGFINKADLFRYIAMYDNFSRQKIEKI